MRSKDIVKFQPESRISFGQVLFLSNRRGLSNLYGDRSSEFTSTAIFFLGSTWTQNIGPQTNLVPRAFHHLAQRKRETEAALSRGPFKKLRAAYGISLVRHCVCFWTRCIRNVCAEKGGGCRWKEKKKQRSKPLFSMFYSVVKTIEQEVLQIVYYISFFAYLARSRLVTTNFHCYISFYTLYEPFTPIYNDQLLQK